MTTPSFHSFSPASAEFDPRPESFSPAARGLKALTILCFVLSAACVSQAAVPLDPELAKLPAAARIMAAPVFEHPLDFVGQEPPPQETEDLWAAIDVLREHGPKVGVAALEAFWA